MVTVDPPQRIIERLAKFDMHPGPLPYEEVNRLGVYERCLIVEKRHPRAHPAHVILVGTGSPVHPEGDLYAAGVMRVQRQEVTG